MDAKFELFDLVSGNVLDTFECEADAKELLVEIARESGEGQVARFALIQDRAGQSTLIAMKGDLVRKVALEMERFISVDGEGGVVEPIGRSSVDKTVPISKVSQTH